MALDAKIGMTFFPWEERYAVHVPIIDSQHQRIFKEINTLVRLLDNKPSLGAIEAIVDDMIDHVENHLRTEEQYLAKHPDFASHKDKHLVFSERIKEFDRQLFATKPEAMALSLFLFLGAWLQNHILTEDQLYFDYLRNNSLLPPP